MLVPDHNEWLQAGIAAVKSGDCIAARNWLTKVLDADEENEQAWLWLSVAVETDDDRRVCLENALALNPDCQIAQKGLQSISESESRHIDVGRGSAALARTTLSESQPSIDASDVWDSDEDICAFCATKVGADVQRCPGCHRTLVNLKYRYPATSILHFFWVLLFTLGLLLLFQALFKYGVERDRASAVLHGVPGALLILLTIGVYLRLFAAHLISIVVLILVLILSIITLVEPFDTTVLALEGVDVAVQGVTSGLVERISILAEVVQLAVAGLTLLYSIFRAGPEFDRVAERQIARTQKGLHTAVDYHMTARRLGQNGKWASAALHWQRAAAIDPTKIVYHRELAKTYFRLGFEERGIRVLRAVEKRPMQPASRAELARLQEWGQRIAGKQGRPH